MADGPKTIDAFNVTSVEVGASQLTGKVAVRIEGHGVFAFEVGLARQLAEAIQSEVRLLDEKGRAPFN